MPLWRDGRPRKAWRYVGVYGEDVMLCAGIATIGPAPQAFWAVWDRRERRLHERTSWLSRRVRLPDGAVRVHDRGVEVDLRLEPAGEPIEVVSPHGGSYIWTRKVPLRAVGTVRVAGVARRVAAAGLLDDSAGYHARRTDWEWCAGVGTTDDGRAVTWNLVAGVHDVGEQTERAMWIDGVPQALGTMEASERLEHVTNRDGADLHFTAEAVRARHDKAGPIMASDYVQPFGLFSGTLPRNTGLAAGFGVMERHSARW
jgi:hypothetical protein